LVVAFAMDEVDFLKVVFVVAEETAEAQVGTFSFGVGTLGFA